MGEDRCGIWKFVGLHGPWGSPEVGIDIFSALWPGLVGGFVLGEIEVGEVSGVESDSPEVPGIVAFAPLIGGAFLDTVLKHVEPTVIVEFEGLLKVHAVLD